jgi:hypothetical protein
MRCFLGRTAAVLVGAGLAGLASAQQPAPLPPPINVNVPNFNPGSGAVLQPGATLNGQVQPPVSLQSTVPIFNPAYPNAPGGGYGGYGYGGGGGYGRGLGGYLNGAANLTVANAQYQLTTQQAKIVREQARREAIETRRATMQEQEYERDEWLRRTDPETQHQKDLERALRRSLNDPPSSEIWAGTALNAILKDVQNAQSTGTQGPPVLLDPEWLPHINLTTGVTTAGVGMLKDLSRFNWPLPLRRTPFQKERTQIEEMTRQAVAQAPAGNIDADLLDKIDGAIGDLEERIRVMAPDMTPTQVIQASRYAHELKDSMKVLQDPNVANYFNNKWKAQGNTVDELVANMTRQGLRFAPAASSDEPAYTALHRALVTYEYRLRQGGGLDGSLAPNPPAP